MHRLVGSDCNVCDSPNFTHPRNAFIVMARSSVGIRRVVTAAAHVTYRSMHVHATFAFHDPPHS